MKLVVLAHTPPPFHGQSYMVRILLDCARHPPDDGAGAAGDPMSAEPTSGLSALELVHVDFRLSDSIEDIGRRPWGKLGQVFKHCARAVWARVTQGADTLLYIPAPALRNAVYRDWLVMLCCRPFFARRVLWWQAAGLGQWLERDAKPWERWITRRLVGGPDLSIVLGTGTESDARALGSRRIGVVPNAIPDPCARDAADLVRARAARRARQRELLAPPAAGADRPTEGEPAMVRFRLLFLSLCYREKGLFDALEAVACLNRRLAARHAILRVQLEVAGRFYLASEQKEFEERIRQDDLCLEIGLRPNAPGAEAAPAVRYHGFAAGEAKERLFRECDLLVFPTYYEAESYPLVLVEAMAYGLDIITTTWRNIPELLPAEYPGLVSPRNPAGIADALEHFLTRYEGAGLRRRYEEYHSAGRFWSGMRSALFSLESATDSAGRATFKA
ncbi:MAG: glycosyltransferase [Verrucomicrobia bacterium]|nr:glycosyltransferase [Verrucomicrobiota bacterium]